MTGRKYVLLDRDGTIIREKNYLASPTEIELLPGAASGLRAMQDAGYRLIVITNQSGVGRGYLSEAILRDVHTRLRADLDAYGVQLDEIFYCIHTPEDQCSCRKPRTGMVERAVATFRFDPAEAVLVGDKPCDIELGRRCGMTTFLVRTGYGRECEAAGLQADYVCDDLASAANILLSNVQKETVNDYQCC